MPRENSENLIMCPTPFTLHCLLLRLLKAQQSGMALHSNHLRVTERIESLRNTSRISWYWNFLLFCREFHTTKSQAEQIVLRVWGTPLVQPDIPAKEIPGSKFRPKCRQNPIKGVARLRCVDGRGGRSAGRRAAPRRPTQADRPVLRRCLISSLYVMADTLIDRGMLAHSEWRGVEPAARGTV